MLTRGGLADGNFFVVTTNCKKSAQVLIPIYEPKFSEGSYGYRPNRSAKDAICKVKEYADEGYKYAILQHTITNERLACRGYYDISEAYKSLHYL